VRRRPPPPNHSPPPGLRAPLLRRQRHGKKALRRAARAAAAAADDPRALPLLRRDRDASVACLDPEVEEGNVEFKLMLTEANASRYEQLVRRRRGGGDRRARPASRGAAARLRGDSSLGGGQAAVEMPRAPDRNGNGPAQLCEARRSRRRQLRGQRA
jgi:hypothetical protein